MFINEQLTLLTIEQARGIELEAVVRYGHSSALSDLAILTGAKYGKGYVYEEPPYNKLKDRSGLFYTKSSDGDGHIQGVDEYGFATVLDCYSRNGAIRPVLLSSPVFSQIVSNKVSGSKGTYEVEYGEYPQYAPNASTQRRLESEYQNRRLKKTGRSYTFDSTAHARDNWMQGFQAVTYDEYEYSGRKYIRVKANSSYDGSFFVLSNGEQYRDGDYVWVEVSPVKWLIDDITKTLISKKGLLSGIRFSEPSYYDGYDINYYGGCVKIYDDGYDGDFSTTEMKEYLDKYMSKDLFQSATFDMTPEEKMKFEEVQKNEEKRRNPYGLNFEQVSEEQIIRGAIESGVAVFLHGQSSEGKSARVKQIDQDCVIIYLRNATPESLNGKSVYNSETGEMIDVKPTWLKKLEDRCEKEPDKYHIVLLDEITNALPSIQGIAFNIVLDREVNGIWQLPENARIVAAGNDMKDSLAANQLAEPLFSRFAHVYIKTTVESWLEWASEHNIHPAIYAYIAYKKDGALRSKYDGEKPNADPRKWEMASKMLYATRKPEILRSLVGEEITREFCRFCNQRVITLDDVLKGNYTESDLQMNTSEIYATAMGLSQVDEANFSKVREFISKLGGEPCNVFDSLWAHGDEARLEIVAEARLENSRGGRRI